jgi:hypothetical protein
LLCAAAGHLRAAVYSRITKLASRGAGSPTYSACTASYSTTTAAGHRAETFGASAD